MPLKAGKGERPWGGAFLGLSTEGRQAAVPMGAHPGCAVLRKEIPTTPLNFEGAKVTRKKEFYARPVEIC